LSQEPKTVDTILDRKRFGAERQDEKGLPNANRLFEKTYAASRCPEPERTKTYQHIST
jgi:hypothetical protein